MGLQDDLLTLAIKVENGEASAAEISVVQKAVDSLGESSTKLGSNFAKPIEHAGLHLLTHELAAASGVAGQSRVAFMLANAAAAGLGETAMAVLGPLALAIGSAALAYELLGKNTEKAKKAAEEDLQVQKDLAKQYRETIKTLDDAGIATSALHDALQKGLGVATVQTAHDMGRAMGELEKDIIKNKDEIASANVHYKEAVASSVATGTALRGLAENIRTLNVALVENQAKLALMKADLPAVAKGHESFAAAAKEHADAIVAAEAADKKFASGMQEVSDKLREGKKNFDAWAESQSAETRKIIEAAQAHGDKVDELTLKYDGLREASRKAFEEEQKKVGTNLDDPSVAAQRSALTQIEANRSVAISAAELAEKTKLAHDSMAKSAEACARRIQGAMNSAITEVVLKHQTLQEASHKVWQQMESDAIQSALKIAEDYIAKNALKAASDRLLAALNLTLGSQVGNASAASIAVTNTSVKALDASLGVANEEALALSATLKTCAIP